MGKNRENLAKLFFIIFLVSLIISYAFAICCFEHECIGDECTVCYGINLMKDIFDNLLIILLISEYIKQVKEKTNLRKYILKIRDSLTLVKLKVEMLN